jgi:hypothetical protein
MLTGASANRLTLVVRSVTGTAYLGRDNTVTTANGFAVPAGTAMEFNGYMGPVWVVGSGATVSWMEEAL